MATVEGKYDFVTVTADDGDVQIELFDREERSLEGYTYLTPEQADAVAVALIQATPAPCKDDAEIPPTLMCEEKEYRMYLGLALIRSAR